MLIVRAVRRSHFELVDESERVCQRAVLRMKGALGTSSFTSAEGEDSMVATAAVVVVMGCYRVPSRES